MTPQMSPSTSNFIFSPSSAFVDSVSYSTSAYASACAPMVNLPLMACFYFKANDFEIGTLHDLPFAVAIEVNENAQQQHSSLLILNMKKCSNI